MINRRIADSVPPAGIWLQTANLSDINIPEITSVNQHNQNIRNLTQMQR